MRTLGMTTAIGVIGAALCLLTACGGGGGGGGGGEAKPTEASTPDPSTKAYAGHPSNGTVLMLDGDTGELKTLAPLTSTAPVVGTVAVREGRAATHAGTDKLMVVAEGTSNPVDVLHTIDLSGPTSQEVGEIAGTQILALAYDETKTPGVLYGFDANTSQLVTIDATNASVRHIGQRLGRDRITAMAYDPATQSLVALDRETGALLDVVIGQAPIGGAPLVTAQEFGTSRYQVVHAIALLPNTDEMLFLDTTRGQFVRVHRFTGDPIEALPGPPVHRGGADQAVIAMWPRGNVRASALRTYGVAIGDEYDEGTLLFKQGEKVLFEQAYDPEGNVDVVALPKALAKALKVGDTLTWGVYDKKGKALSEATCTLVDAPEADAALKAVAENAYVSRQAPEVGTLLRARALRKAGLHAEALEQFVAAAVMAPKHKTAMLGLRASLVEILPDALSDWQAGELVQWITAGPKADDSAVKALLGR
ncbi:MAG: hypothetical protein QNJ98_04570 [Planctomycetota bacterium]|nr:hypothetical protein [Planctomycetota bacterium]